MRDVTQKIDTLRTAKAVAELRASPSTLQMIRDGKVPKGDPLPVAKVAAVSAAKNTPLFIPYCHPVPLTALTVEFEMGESWIRVTCEAKAIYKTGVEMEALTAAAAAALNLYDMLKMVDEEMEIVGVRLLEKRGGKSDFRKVQGAGKKALVLVVSDSVSRGDAEDLSGAILNEKLQDFGLDVAMQIVADEADLIRHAVQSAVAEGFDMVVSTGGTGVGPRDVTPEAVRPMLERELEGAQEAFRSFGQVRTPYAMLSRCVCGLIGETLILCLPGSPAAVEDGLTALFPYLLHILQVREGCRHEPVSEGASA